MSKYCRYKGPIFWDTDRQVAAVVIYFISISTQTQNIKLYSVGKYNQSKDEKADKQH